MLCLSKKKGPTEKCEKKKRPNQKKKKWSKAQQITGSAKGPTEKKKSRNREKKSPLHVRESTVCALAQTTLKTPDARSWMTS